MGIGNLLLELEFVLNQQERGALLINWVCRKGVCVTSIIRLLGHVDEPAGAAPSEGKIAMVQAAGGIFAGSTASCIATPLDTIKTRLQVMGHEKKTTVREVVKKFVC
ncbi:uncharacterized protein [Henckelia pumila]|uniref:uncharacterized protein n=1 Tax=Henckelia pumila TaxID=405737 RepID=UPI003C6DE604